MEKDIKWTCPKCSQVFHAVNQEHYCIPDTVSFYLDKCSPVVRTLFHSLNMEVKGFGFYELLPANSSLQYKANAVFLTIRFKSESLELEFQSDRKSTPFTTKHSVKIAIDRYLHKIDIEKTMDIDACVLQALQNSFSLNA